MPEQRQHITKEDSHSMPPQSSQYLLWPSQFGHSRVSVIFPSWAVYAALESLLRWIYAVTRMARISSGFTRPSCLESERRVSRPFRSTSNRLMNTNKWPGGGAAAIWVRTSCPRIFGNCSILVVGQSGRSVSGSVTVNLTLTFNPTYPKRTSATGGSTSLSLGRHRRSHCTNTSATNWLFVTRYRRHSLPGSWRRRYSHWSPNR